MPGVQLEVGGRPFEVAPFKLGELRKAAPHIDRMNDLMKIVEDGRKAEPPQDPPMAVLADLMHELCEICAIGLGKIDPEMNCDWLEDQIDLSFIMSLQEAVIALLRSSGLAPKGEAQAPSALAEGARAGSESSLAGSSAS